MVCVFVSVYLWVMPCSYIISDCSGRPIFTFFNQLIPTVFKFPFFFCLGNCSKWARTKRDRCNPGVGIDKYI